MNLLRSFMSFAMVSLSLMAQAQCSELLISEYGEGSAGGARYIELYNPGSTSVALSPDYRLWFISDSGSWPESYYAFPAGAQIAPGDVVVVASSSASVPGADYYSSALSFNGDDAVGLARKSGSSYVLIDAVGSSGADPGPGWPVAGTSNATVDRVLVRKASVQQGSTLWSASSGSSPANSAWIVAQNPYSSGAPATLGSHSSDCQAQAPCIAPAMPGDVVVSGIIAILIGLAVDPSPGGADGYLTVMSGEPSLSASPANGTVYAPGTALGNGVVVASGSETAFQVSTGYMEHESVYYLHVFAYRQNGCSGGPAYSAGAASTSASMPAANRAGGGAGSAFFTVLPGAWLRVHLEMPAREPLQIELLDLAGRKVQQWERLAQGSFEEDFSIAHLPDGLYLLRLSSPSQQVQAKVYSAR